jgi:hypothetical protein
MIIGNAIDKFDVELGLLILTTYGFINGLSTILFVAPYRKQVKQQLVDRVMGTLCVWKRNYAAPILAWDPNFPSNAMSTRRTG